MRLTRTLCTMVLPMFGFSTGSFGQATTDYFALAYHWAPIHIQNVHSQTEGVQDFITRFNYDGNWKGADNWDNLSAYEQKLEAVAYYAVAESATHFFVYYGFFHPRDWGSLTTTHENDMEGVVFSVRKDGSPYGRLESAVAAAHGYHFPYENPAVWYLWPANPPRAVRTMQLATGFISGETHGRPWTYQEDQGHGLFLCGEFPDDVAFGVTTPDLSDCWHLPGNKIFYLPSRSYADISTLPPLGGFRYLHYRLIDVNGPSGWFTRRHDYTTFHDYASAYPRQMAGDCNWADVLCQTNAANPLWGWGDGAIDAFTWGKDPALMFRTYWGSALGPASSSYVANDFAAGGNPCTVNGVALSAGSTSPSCVRNVCAHDGYCCSVSWDSICLAEVPAMCGKSCDTCAHPPNVVGVAVSPSCSSCATEVCNRDPYCCNNRWDSICVTEAAVCDFRYDVHQQDNGWIGPCTQGQACGVTGQSRRLEAVRIFDPTTGGTVCYSVHLQGLGWQPEVCSGRIAGTQNQSRRLEAIRIHLIGAPAGHRICYRAHVQDYGWQGEVCDNSISGTTGKGKRIESLQIRLVR